MSTAESLRFDPALIGEPCWMRTADGIDNPLPTSRWLGSTSTTADRHADSALITCCDGPTVDLGCGPGRLVAALLQRGIAALGVDISPLAIAVARHRGAPALRRSLFEALPGDGRWRYALLADGNIGIGGNPHQLLARTARLLAAGGIAVVEFAPPGTGLQVEPAQLYTKSWTGEWFPWALVGVDHAAQLAADTGFELLATAEVAGRHIAWLQRRTELDPEVFR